MNLGADRGGHVKLHQEDEAKGQAQLGSHHRPYGSASSNVLSGKLVAGGEDGQSGSHQLKVEVGQAQVDAK